MICLIPASHGSLAVAVKSNAKYIFRTTAMLFRILQKNCLNKSWTYFEAPLPYQT